MFLNSDVFSKIIRQKDTRRPIAKDKKYSLDGGTPNVKSCFISL